MMLGGRWVACGSELGARDPMGGTRGSELGAPRTRWVARGLEPGARGPDRWHSRTGAGGPRI